MVYYQKDDLTEYSKPLGLNKVKRKHLVSYSENDMSSRSSNDSRKSKKKGFGRDSSLNKSNNKSIKSSSSVGKGGRGALSKSGMSSKRADNKWDEDDAWKDRRLMRKKKKLNKKQKKRIAALGAIYGQDARTLAGLNNPDRWKSHFGEYDTADKQPKRE
jgi:hypothetical protein